MNRGVNATSKGCRNAFLKDLYLRFTCGSGLRQLCPV